MKFAGVPPSHAPLISRRANDWLIAQVKLTGLRRAKRYLFVEYQPAIRPTVTVTQVGPIPSDTGSPGPVVDFLGPEQGLETQGSGKLTGAKSGRSGSLAVTLPGGDQVSGHWNCRSSTVHFATQEPNRPALVPAEVPPLIDECWIRAAAGSPPVTCPNGDINVAAWPAYLPIAGLGRDVTVWQVDAALCQEQKQATEFGAPATPADLESEYLSAAAYYGWKFDLTPQAVIVAGGCPT